MTPAEPGSTPRRKPFAAIRKGLIEHVLSGRLTGNRFAISGAPNEWMNVQNRPRVLVVVVLVATAILTVSAAASAVVVSVFENTGGNTLNWEVIPVPFVENGLDFAGRIVLTEVFTDPLISPVQPIIFSITVSLPVFWTPEGDTDIAAPSSIVDPDATVRLHFTAHAAAIAIRAPAGVR